jgi:pentatricopeptide repeat protein
MLGGRSRLPLSVILAAVFVFLFCSLFSFFIFEHIPHVNDEIAYLFQAKIFKSGRLYAPSPPCREYFDFPHVINNGRWYSIYPPGFPFLLMLGLIFGVPWLVNPLLASLSIIMFYFLGKEIYDHKTGLLASLLGSVSIWFLLMSSTMMSHTSSMFFNALFLLFLFRSLKNPSLTNGLLAGASLGIAFLIRPYNAILFAIPFIIYYSVLIFRNLKSRIKNVLALALTSLTFVCLLFLYNSLTNGNPLLMGHIVRYGNSYSVIFGRPATLDFNYTPLFAATQLGDNLKALNSNLFGWPLSSFLALVPLFWLTRIKSIDRKKDLLLASSIAFFFIGFYFFWGAFVFIGARMFFDCLPLFFLLSARGLSELPGLLGKTFNRLKPRAAARLVTTVIIVFIFYAFIFRFPRLIWPAHAGWHFDRYDSNFAGTNAQLNNTLQSLGLKSAVVILKFINRPPKPFPHEGGWGSGFLYNNPDLSTNVIYARDRGEENKGLFTCFPEKDVFLYVGTIEKGMLFPLKKEGEKIFRQKPILSAKKGKKSIELIIDPKLFFETYSEEFSGFLENLFRDYDICQVNVDWLVARGNQSMVDHDFQQAAFYFEAALQVENDPETRRTMLDLLISCYQKSGQMNEAKKIIDYMEKMNFNERKLYSVLPERGF